MRRNTSHVTDMSLIIAKNQRSVKPLSVLVQEMRIIKSDNEIELMKQSGYISAKAFIEASIQCIQ